jgi:eukaryotic-like serine/threonine-protein kinase
MAERDPNAADKTPRAGADSEPAPDFDSRQTQNLSAPPLSTFFPGEVLAGRFKVLRFIARGGMGEVYEAEDLEFNERVAVKTARVELIQGAHEIERFRREIQLARKVTHPNVCRTFDVFRHFEKAADGSSRETLFVSMELLTGETLENLVRREGRLLPSAALPIVKQMAAGLSAAHQAGVIHRDFKSTNVILISPGSGSQSTRAVITDFGLAHSEYQGSHTITRPGDIVGTPAYMAPEQVEGAEITPATDIYALGVVLYEMLTGALPFSADTPLATAMKRLNQPAPALRSRYADADPVWERVVARCLERQPARRYASPDDVIKDLEGESVPRPPAAAPSAEELTTSLAKSRRWLLAALAAVIFSVLAVIGIALVKRHFAAQQSAATPAGRPAVAILGFTNLSGRKDADVLGDILADCLWSQLDTDEIRFIVPSDVDDMKRNLGLRELPASLSNDQIGAIRKFLGADVLIGGSYTLQGPPGTGKIQWNIHMVRTGAGKSLGSIEQSGSESDVNDLAIHAGRLIRQQLGVQLAPSEEARMDGSLSAVPDAMRYFAESREKLRDFEVLAATRLLDKAIVADPNFAQAHNSLAQAWLLLGFDEKAKDEAKKAFDLSSKLSAEARGLVTASYYQATHDWDKAIQEYSSLWSQYRDNPQYGLLLARTQINASKAKNSLTTLTQLRSQALPPGIAAQADLAEAEAQKSLAAYKEQLAAADAAATKAQSLGATLLLARARQFQCSAHASLGEFEQARPLCEDSLKLNTAAGDQLGAANANNEMANALYEQGKFAEAAPLYEAAVSLAQSIGDKQDEAGAINNLARIHDNMGNRAAAIQDYRKSIEIAQERGDQSDVAIAQQNLAGDLYLDGKQAEGNKMFASALAIARATNDTYTEAAILANQCNLELSAGDVTQARRNCEESLRLRRAADDRAGIGKSLTNLGDVQLAQKNLDAAAKSYAEALSILGSIGANGDAAYTRISLASLALAQNHPDSSREYAANAATELAAENDPGGEAQARSLLADGLLASNKVPEAQAEIKKATPLAQTANDQSVLLGAAIVEAKVNSRSGQADGALKSLAAIQNKAHSAGLLQIEFQARVALGEVQIRAGRTAAGRASLAAVARDAKSKGFALIAENATAAAQK